MLGLARVAVASGAASGALPLRAGANHTPVRPSDGAATPPNCGLGGKRIEIEKTSSKREHGQGLDTETRARL